MLLPVTGSLKTQASTLIIITLALFKTQVSTIIIITLALSLTGQVTSDKHDEG
jgi:hypothetical protein